VTALLSIMKASQIGIGAAVLPKALVQARVDVQVVNVDQRCDVDAVGRLCLANDGRHRDSVSGEIGSAQTRSSLQTTSAAPSVNFSRATKIGDQVGEL
jgi:hypothetical protein